MPYTIDFSQEFIDDLNKDIWGIGEANLAKITDFIAHIKQNGFVGLEGRNKRSDNVNDATKRNYAQQNNLWHYHIGIPVYDRCKQDSNQINYDCTSRYVLHYQFDYSCTGTNIKIVDLSVHPPFDLPNQNALV